VTSERLIKTSHSWKSSAPLRGTNPMS